MKCVNCGTELSEGQKFCQNCGTKNEIQKKTCPFCNSELKEGAGFCSSCGKSLKDIKKSDEENHNVSSKGDFGQRENWFSQETLASYVGKNQKYYSKEFKKIHEGGKSKFNWVAFFFGPLLCLYRKNFSFFFKLYLIPILLYLVGIPAFTTYQTVSLLSGNIEGLAGMVVLQIIVMVVGITVGIISGLKFNRSYYEMIKAIVENGNAEAENQKKKYGVSWKYVIISILIYIGISFAVNSLTATVIWGQFEKSMEQYDAQMDDFNWSEEYVYGEDIETSEFMSEPDLSSQDTADAESELDESDSYSGPFPIESIIDGNWYQSLNDGSNAVLGITANEDGSLHLDIGIVSGTRPYIFLYSGDSVQVSGTEMADLWIQFASEDSGMLVDVSWANAESIDQAQVYCADGSIPSGEYVGEAGMTDYVTVDSYTGTFPVESIINTEWSCYPDDLTNSLMTITLNSDGSLHMTIQASSARNPYVNNFSGNLVQITGTEMAELYLRFTSDGTDPDDPGDDVTVAWASVESIDFPVVDGADPYVTYLYDGQYSYSRTLEDTEW